MIVLSGDLSTRCTGIIVAEIKNDRIVKMLSTPIVPKRLDITEEFGFMKSKKKLPTRHGGSELINTYYRRGEESVSKDEKKKRDVSVRQKQNLFILTQMSKDIGDIVDGVKPDVIIYEKNAIFNGILTIELLAKLAGTLVGIAGSHGIPIYEYPVQRVRKRHNPAQLVKDFVKGKNSDYIQSLDDVTKAALRERMQQKYGQYGLELKSDDEGDAAVVFDYWYEEIHK